jgi:hypothetical protein
MIIQTAIKPNKKGNKTMQRSHTQRSLRRDFAATNGSYADRNDGWDRTHHSRSKNRSSEIKKETKVKRIKPVWKK